MRRATPVALLLALTPTAALAQDASAPPPEVNPLSVVAAARGDAAPVAVETRRHRRRDPYESTLRLALTRYRCYEVIGYATGTSPVFVEVRVGRAQVGQSMAITNSVGRVARQRFCAEQPGELYSLETRAEGEAWWYVAVTPTAETVAAAPPPGERTTEGPAPAAREGVRVSAETHVVGGDGADYVSQQVLAFARQRPGVTGFTPLVRRVLPTNGVYESTLVIPSGRCIDVVAAGVPSVADLVLELEDPNGHRVAQDAARRGSESIRHCALYAGTYRLRVRVFSGAGLVGTQVLLEP